MKKIYEDFNIEDRENKIMLSAPHRWQKYKNGRKYKRETKTGILVKEVSKQLNLPCIYKTKFYKNDPNSDEKSTYRAELVDFINKNQIKLLFDIHSMNANREEDICIGINNGENIFNRMDLCEVIKNTFNEFKIDKVSVDMPFKASKSTVISYDISHKCKIPCFQIEINNRFLFATYDTYNYQLIKKVLIEIISEIEKRI